MPTSTASYTPTPTATPIPAWSVSLSTDGRLMPGSTLTMPVTIASGSGVSQLALTVTFDPSVVAVQDAEVSAAAGPGTVTTDTTVSGAVTLWISLAQPMTAGGSLVDITFVAVGACPASTGLDITSCVLDAGAITCQPSDGQVSLLCGVGGRIRHWRTRAPVAGATVALMSAQSSVIAPTNDLGQYSFSDMTAGTLELEPQKTGDLQGSVSAYDAAIVLQAVAGWRQLDPMQQLACDVTGNGQVSALDAARIMQVAVGALAHFPVADTCGSDWAFVPAPATLPNQRVVEPRLGTTSCQPGIIMFDPLLGDAAQQDFTGVPFGDCSGNWSAASMQRSGLLKLSRDMRVRLGTARQRDDGQWAVPLYVASSAPYQAIDAQISYDPAVHPTDLRAVGGAHDAMVSYQADGNGGLKIALASAVPLAGDGSLVAVLTFDGPPNAATAPLARLLNVAIDEVPVGVEN